ncbi:MAG: AAA family ATPase [Leptospiraceae bacterium]|nr:AAA family ATPase [Leptospiraceae bacterium]
MATQYWAGGWWGQGNPKETIQNLIDEGYWRIGWERNENKVASTYYNYLDRDMNVGDEFALKGMAGRKNIRIYAKGKIKGFENDTHGLRKKVLIEWTNREAFLMTWPKGKGTGNWTATLLKITDDELNQNIFNSNIVDYTYLQTLTVKKYYSIDDIHIENLDTTNEIFFLGENNQGKTLLLQSIFITLYYEALSQNSIFKKINIANLEQCIADNDKLSVISETTNSELNLEKKEIKFIFKETKYWVRNIFAYGVNRTRNANDKSSTEDDTYAGFMTLFEDEGKTFLRNPDTWLQDWDYWEKGLLAQGEYNKEEISFSVEDAKNIIQELIEEEIEITVNHSGVLYKEKGSKTSLSFNDFSAGYKNLISWVCDLISRLQDNQPDIKPVKDDTTNKLTFDYKGIVLVDEIDLHIHPKWAINIVTKLRNWFPRIQFLFTTHNPVVLLGASKDAVIYKVYKEEGITKISEPYYNSDDKNMEGFNSIRNYRLDQIVTSELFNVSAMPQNLRRRKELLEIEESKRTSDENNELEQLNHDIGYIPVGETKEEIKMFKLMENFTKSIEKGIQK